MAWWQWSKTSASNSGADPSINWAEGMSPSAVNDSGRAMMAASAQYRDDISGVIATTGTSTAYAAASNSSLAAIPNNGQLIAFTPHVTNGISATLAVDGGTAYPLQSSAGTAIAAGSLVQGTPYTVVFVLASAAWVLRNFYGNQFNIPLGGVMTYLGSVAPNSNFALAFGQAISRTTYATLFALIGTTYGAGDGVTTFSLPDLRDRTIFGLGNMGGVAAGRISVAGGNYDSTINGATGGLQNHLLTITELPVHTPAGTIAPLTATGNTGLQSASHTHGGTTDNGGVDHTHTVNDALSKVGQFSAGGSNGWAANQIVNSSGASAFLHSHTYTTGTEVGNHSHSFTSSPFTPIFSGVAIGSGAAHTILPPAISLPMIVRIA